jgi:GT2 family glycosyltransferase
MPGSPEIADRTWFGIAHCADGRIDIEGAVEPWSGRHDRAQILIVDRQGPIDWLLLGPDDDMKEKVSKRIAQTMEGDRPATPERPSGQITIAICTRERPQFLRDCLERLRTTVGDRYEILVVDNAPRTAATLAVVREFADSGMRITSVIEKRAGLSRARNRAIAEATSRYVAFTDDDALPGPGWPEALHRGFAAGDRIAVVTGIVPPAQIETRAQALFEKKLKWSNNLKPETFSVAEERQYSWTFPYSAGNLGTGANFAVDREIIVQQGGFDEALGAGTRTSGGEDLEMFVRVLRNGFQVRFQPSAIVWQVHISDVRTLRKILFGYGKGLSATFCSELLQPGRLDLIRGTLRGALNLAHDRQAELEFGMPKNYILLEIAGLACGPIAYVMERWFGPRTG